MIERLTQCEGQLVADKFVVGKSLGGSARAGVFLTQLSGTEPRPAAIKLLELGGEASELQLARWNAMAQLSHPHLQRLYEAGRCQLGGLGQIYAVVEYAEEDLSQILPQRALTPAEARDVLKALLGALAFLHARGLVHGRIQPSNILAVDDRIKLSCDSLVPTPAPRDSSANPTPYLPPEAAHSELSAAGDVWSLGVTLVELLTQRVPSAAGNEHPDPPLPEGIPAPFAEIARRCLRGEPFRRATIAELAAALDCPASAPRKPVALPRREPSPKPHRRFVLPVVILAAIVLAVLGVPKLFKRPAEAPAPAPVSTSSPADLRTAPLRNSPSASGGPPARESAAERRGAAGAPQPAKSAPATPQTQPLSGKIVRGEVLRRVVPTVGPQARDSIRGTVRVSVRVSVDSSGNVVAAALVSPGPSRYFAKLALDAAREWQFIPAKLDGRYAPSEWLLRFEFTSAQTQVFPSPTKP
jgi:TonB family protein